MYKEQKNKSLQKKAQHKPQQKKTQILTKKRTKMSQSVTKTEALPRRQITLDDLSDSVRAAQYAVRGELVIKAENYKNRLLAGDKSLPFDKLSFCNIGNPHELGQKPVTFFRQVIALAHYPDLMTNPITAAAFPPDAIARAQKYLGSMSSTGAYSHSKGIKVFRDEVAQFIKRRDGYEVDAENLFLTNGASSAVSLVLQMLIKNKGDAVLTPIPQYPLYSATLQLLQGELTGYYLDESNGWTLTVNELETRYNEAVAKGHNPKAITIINPGNPTGQCLKYDTIKDIVKWSEGKNLVILADEVYQENIYSTTPFVSFFKVANDIKSTVPIVSFHSASKGVVGECGARGGYGHWHNFPKEILDEAYKMSSISLCSNITGQMMMGLICNPPQEGEPSFAQYKAETQGQLESLQRRAKKLGEALNKLEGVSCQPIEGAMYAFPTVTLSVKANEAAKAMGKTPDTMYALSLLDETGIVCVPRAGFKQVPGTLHYRTTILPSEEAMDGVIEKMNVFHQQFMDKYRD